MSLPVPVPIEQFELHTYSMSVLDCHTILIGAIRNIVPISLEAHS